MIELDLFGEPVMEPWPVPQWAQGEKPKRRHDPIPAGYARQPGTGPTGETCRTCEHAMRIRLSRKTIYKCVCNQPKWTHGRKSDIVLKAPACLLWTQRYQIENAPFIDRLKD